MTFEEEYNINWSSTIVFEWPNEPGAAGWWAVDPVHEPGDPVAIIGFGPPGEPVCISARAQSEHTSLEDLIGSWEEGEDLQVQLGHMPRADYDRLPEFDGW